MAMSQGMAPASEHCVNSFLPLCCPPVLWGHIHTDSRLKHTRTDTQNFRESLQNRPCETLTFLLQAVEDAPVAKPLLSSVAGHTQHTSTAHCHAASQVSEHCKREIPASIVSLWAVLHPAPSIHWLSTGTF